MALREIDKHFWNTLNENAKAALTRQLYDTFVMPAKLISVDGNHARILVNSEFHKLWWQKQTDMVAVSALEIYGDVLQYAIIQENELSDAERQEFEKENTDYVQFLGPDSDRKYQFPTNLKKKYTFDNFVVGEQNRLAQAMVEAIAITQDNTLYNPVLIYASSGLGKTHLLHALGNKWLSYHPTKSVLYCPTESFVTDYVNMSRQNQMELFIHKYRDVDLLLIDDVQFFVGKEGSINEFFQTIRTLIEDKEARVVLTSDRPISELNDLPERLITRFTWGTQPIQITAPDYETRMGILKNKADTIDVTIPEETISYIAGQVNSNVRELEGTLNQVVFSAKMQHKNIVDIETAEHALEALKVSQVHTRRSNLTITRIKDETAKYFHLPLSDLTGPKRQKEIVAARQIAMYLIRELLGTSLPAIGKEFGNRDHTTVMYAVRQVTEKMKNDNDTQRDIDHLKRKLE
ncbi:MAG: chromosomal replication initiator protein DnaA [Streptococcaceae bacterium]|jgi:chromosomal replication initiator protein|nr:chromosomal replication initiator protein DnaA [Streptococcaceae bacterium]